MTDRFHGLLKPLASLRLTVALLALSMVLIFAGTWAQIDLGIWAVLTHYFRTFYVFIPFQLFAPRHWNVPGGIPFPGGYVLGGLLLANVLAAHAVRFKFNRRRIGIILIHLGVILLLVGELVTALTAVESNMTLDVGSSANFTEDIREVELAVIDPRDPQVDRVVALPEAMLAWQSLIAHPDLPFEIHVDQFMLNSQVLGPFQAQGRQPQANRGFAAEKKLVFEEKPPISGVESNAVDARSAIITLFHNGQNLGTWAVSLYLEGHQVVMVDNRPYLLALRFKREYKDYTLHLIEFRHDKYLGTETPRNFSSHVRLVDPRHNEDREVLIYMNNPLRYRGETFYQASFKPGDQTSILQVVRNPGWLMPYIACTVGAIGMTLHFSMNLLEFLRKRKSA